MSIQGIGSSASIHATSVAILIGNGDMESVLLAFGVERSQNMGEAVKAKIADMRQRNNAINELRVLMSELRTAEPTTVSPEMKEAAGALLDPELVAAATTLQPPEVFRDALQMGVMGQQMEGWASVGGYSWMNPDFKDVLDRFDIPHKASNMSKEAMSDGRGGWHVAYRTGDYHQLGREVQAKARDIIDGKNPDYPPTHVSYDAPLPNGKTLGQILEAGGIQMPKDPELGYRAMDPDELKAKAEAIIAGTDPDHPPTHINLDAPTSKGGKTMLEVLEASGIPLPTGPDGKPATSVTPEQIKTMMENLESEIDRLTTNDQLDMITLQSMVSKQNNALEMLTNLCSKFSNLNDKICSNMR